MSDQYVELEVSERTAKFNKIMMIIAIPVSVLLIIVSAIFFVSGDEDTGIFLAVIGFLIMVGAIFIYYISAVISYIIITAGASNALKMGLLVIVLIVVSLGATFLLVMILTA